MPGNRGVPGSSPGLAIGQGLQTASSASDQAGRRIGSGWQWARAFSGLFNPCGHASPAAVTQMGTSVSRASEHSPAAQSACRRSEEQCAGGRTPRLTFFLFAPAAPQAALTWEETAQRRSPLHVSVSVARGRVFSVSVDTSASSRTLRPCPTTPWRSCDYSTQPWRRRYRDALTQFCRFGVEDFGDGVVGVVPAEGAGSVARHFELHKVCARKKVPRIQDSGLRSQPPPCRRHR